MERQINLSSDFILFVWMMVLAMFAFVACSEDNDINPRTERELERVEYDFRHMDEGEQEVEVIQWKNNFPKHDIASPDTVRPQHVNEYQTEAEY